MDNGHADICKDQFLPFMADMLFFGDKEVILLHYKVWAWSALLPDWLWPTSGENKLKQPTHFQLAHFFYFALWLTPILKNLGFFVAFFLYYLASLLQDIIHGVKKGDCMSFRCQVWKRPTQSSASSSVQTWNHHLVQITYDCQPGFQLVGGATKICQADGTWTQVMRRIAMRMTLINDVDVDNNAIEANFDNLDNRQSCRCVFLSNYVVMTTGLHISLDVLPFWSDPGPCSPISAYVLIFSTVNIKVFWVIWLPKRVFWVTNRVF